MTEIDRQQLAALDASSAHNVQRHKFEYGEFDTVKPKAKQSTLDKPNPCSWRFDGELTGRDGLPLTVWYCQACGSRAACNNAPVGCSRDEPPSLIQTREETHGDFTVNAQVSQAIKIALRSHSEFHKLRHYQREALDAVAGKMGRIIAGDADFDDHWRDIAGYAQLVVERLPKR